MNEQGERGGGGRKPPASPGEAQFLQRSSLLARAPSSPSPARGPNEAKPHPSSELQLHLRVCWPPKDRAPPQKWNPLLSHLLQSLLLPHAPRPLRTCSRARLSPSTSRWRRSALSSASSACCCRTWILRFTASMVVIPAMVPTQPLLAFGFLPPPLGVAATSHPTSACSALKYRNSPTRPDVTPPLPRPPTAGRREGRPLEGDPRLGARGGTSL